MSRVKDSLPNDRLKEIKGGDYPTTDELRALVEEIHHWRWLDDVSNNLADAAETVNAVLMTEEALRRVRQHLYMNQQAPYGTPPRSAITHNPYVYDSQQGRSVLPDDTADKAQLALRLLEAIAAERDEWRRDREKLVERLRAACELLTDAADE